MADRAGRLDRTPAELTVEFPRSEGKEMIQEEPVRLTGVERRQHPRFPCMLDTSFRRVGQDGTIEPDQSFLKCKTINISEGGLLLEGDAYVSEGQRLEVYVKMEDGIKTMAGEVEAVRSAKKFGKFRIGVRFIKKEVI